LLIGDPALIVQSSEFKVQSSELENELRTTNYELRKFDLVELWRKFTGFGFVFAMWMTHRETCEIDFAGARDEGLSHLSEIIANYEGEIALPREDFKEYLMTNISFSIDDSMQKGLELYFELAFRNNLIKKNKSLEFLL
jgi:chorismate dehydratase